jgi:hypothetical protein
MQRKIGWESSDSGSTKRRKIKDGNDQAAQEAQAVSELLDSEEKIVTVNTIDNSYNYNANLDRTGSTHRHEKNDQSPQAGVRNCPKFLKNKINKYIHN